MKMKACLDKIIELLESIQENTRAVNRSDSEQTAAVRGVVKEVEVIKEVPVEVVKEVEVIKEVPVEVIKEVTVEKEVVKEVPDLFSRELKATGIETFQTAFMEDGQLVKQFVSVSDESSAHQMIRLIATMSQWNNIEELWEIFALRCKQEKRAATQQERFLLEKSLELNNLIYQNSVASLNWPQVGGRYDFKTQTRGNLKGDTVVSVWLPELKSAGGEVRKKPLVETH